MDVVRSVAEMKARANELRAAGRRIGLVPTMGYFHEGHLSLMRESVRESDETVVSLFVNPTQFGPAEDLEKYPRDFERDREMAERTGATILFAPETRDVYPEGFRTYVRVEAWSDLMCGVTRPIHFRGVTTVCCKLFNIVRPHRAYFGQKDAQQALIIRRMVLDLDMDLEVIVLPIVREENGLAMSSRNKYLGPEERREAVRLWKSLCEARRLHETGVTDAAAVRSEMEKIIGGTPLARLDYIEMMDAVTLEKAVVLKPGTLVAVAVFFGGTRLIDNIVI